MALTWEALSLQAVQKTVLLVCSAMLVCQAYLSFVEYHKNEYGHVPEDSALSEVDLPMIIVCHEQPFKLEVSSALFHGLNYSNHFVGWARGNMTTKEYLE